MFFLLKKYPSQKNSELVKRMLGLDQSFTSAPSWETYRRLWTLQGSELSIPFSKTVGAARCKVWLMKSDCLSFEFLDALSPLIHTLIPTAWASDTCRDKKKQDPRFTGSDGKTARQDPRSLGSHNIARIQDPRSKGSHSKTICEIQDS